MPSVLNVDTLTDAAGTGPVTLTKQSAAKHICRQNNGTNDKSLNQSSITDNANGDFTHSFSSSFSDANYVFSGSVHYYGTTSTSAQFEYELKDGTATATGSMRCEAYFITQTANRTLTDADTHGASATHSIVHGDLA
jgi:hypothetical protein